MDLGSFCLGTSSPPSKARPRQAFVLKIYLQWEIFWNHYWFQPTIFWKRNDWIICKACHTLKSVLYPSPLNLFLVPVKRLSSSYIAISSSYHHHHNTITILYYVPPPDSLFCRLSHSCRMSVTFDSICGDCSQPHGQHKLNEIQKNRSSHSSKND